MIKVFARIRKYLVNKKLISLNNDLILPEIFKGNWVSIEDLKNKLEEQYFEIVNLTEELEKEIEVI